MVGMCSPEEQEAIDREEEDKNAEREWREGNEEEEGGKIEATCSFN